MATPVRVPRINNNDDAVRVTRLMAGAGDRVRIGDALAEILTDKASIVVEAEQDGYVLAVLAEPNQESDVGSILMWLGATADERVPEASAAAKNERRDLPEPTAKARALLVHYGLTAEEVPASGARLSAADVEAHASRHGRGVDASSSAATRIGLRSIADGEQRPLTVEERAMLRTVSWHRDHAIGAYVEVEYDPAPWDDYAAAHAAAHRLLTSPLLALMAHRLVTLAASQTSKGKINATIVGDQLHRYAHVNLGFTIQAGDAPYLAVVRHADAMDAAGFVGALGELQRRAIGKQLRPEESQGATVAFSSMARWGVVRHVPVLPPYTSVIVAHAAVRPGNVGILGATYDHRVLSGFDVAQLLTGMSRP
jgi:pyruvate dehydrogenase E2 component (dihydrolipoamide acetyltransferase)